MIGPSRSSRQLFGVLLFYSSTTIASIQVACAQCELDVCGYWYSENYGVGPPVQYFSIDMVGELMVCTKVLGDPYVPTGAVTWRGIPSACSFPGQVFATNSVGGPLSALNCQIEIVSTDHIIVNGVGILHFYRSNTGHLDHVGVDYSAFPVSCIDCSPFPNIFTPNSDGSNDLFELLCGGPSARFAVSDRWGNVVFESFEEKPSWDGRKDWTPCEEGVYYWSMIAKDDRTGNIRHGYVHLLR